MGQAVPRVVQLASILGVGPGRGGAWLADKVLEPPAVLAPAAQRAQYSHLVVVVGLFQLHILHFLNLSCEV